MDENTDYRPSPAPNSRPWAEEPAESEAHDGSAGGSAAAAGRGKKRRRRVVVATSLAAALTLTSVSAWALNRYVIDHVEVSNVSEYEAQQESSADSAGSSASSSDTSDNSGDAASAQVTDSTYTASNASIAIEQHSTGSGDNTVTYYVATVDLSDATALRSAFANDSFGLNITENTSDIAADRGAIFAINGDYYGFRDTGIVIRNGVIYRDDGAREGLAFTVTARSSSTTRLRQPRRNWSTTVCGTPFPSARPLSKMAPSSRVLTLLRWTPTSATTPSRESSHEPSLG